MMLQLDITKTIQFLEHDIYMIICYTCFHKRAELFINIFNIHNKLQCTFCAINNNKIMFTYNIIY